MAISRIGPKHARIGPLQILIGPKLGTYPE